MQRDAQERGSQAVRIASERKQNGGCNKSHLASEYRSEKYLTSRGGLIDYAKARQGISGSGKFFSISGAPLWLRRNCGRMMQRDANDSRVAGGEGT
jgi:hypothetical protein